MRNNTSPTEYHDRVQTILDHGGAVTARYTNTLAAWERYQALDYDPLDALTTALLDETTPPEELARLHTLATLSVTPDPMKEATVRNHLWGELTATLRREYTTVAQANYDTVRDAFNDTAQRFEQAVTTIDPDTPADDIVKATAKVRDAWAAAPVIASELDKLAAVLRTAAELAGKHHGTMRADTLNIGLTIDSNNCHRRRLWEAWNNHDSRAGKWNTLVKLGATINAPELDHVKPYREPQPIQTRYEQTKIGHRPIKVDPEDHDYTPHEDDEPVRRGVYAH